MPGTPACRPECTNLSHSQSLANFVANFHSQGISAARTNFLQFHSQDHSHSVANSFATRNSQLLVEIWWLKFASEFSGRVRIRVRIHSCIAATAVHSAVDPCLSRWVSQGHLAGVSRILLSLCAFFFPESLLLAIFSGGGQTCNN